MGQEEHDSNTRATNVEMDPTQIDDDYDSEEEEGETVMIEKSPEQLTEEAIQRWRLFQYPKWASVCIYFMFLCCLVNVVLTLDQWHGTHSWRQPFDLYPAIELPGGWGDQDLRWCACILGVVSACFTFVLNPTADKFKFMFVLMFMAATMHAVSFGMDLYHLNRAVERPECKDRVNDIQVRKYMCVFDRFRATVIFDIISSVSTYLLSFLVLYQALTGVVSRRQVFNERTGQWEKVIVNPDDEFWVAFPKRFKEQRKGFVLACLFVGVVNAVVLVLTITQQTNDLFQPRNAALPMKNFDRTVPRDLYIIPGNQPNGMGHGLGTGSWPQLNFELRLSANAVALVVLSFLIQWRRDGRLGQLFVLLFLFSAGALYASAFFLDYDEYDSAEAQGTEWAEAQGSLMIQHRYTALIIFDGFCAFTLLLFSLYNLLQYLIQCRDPINKTEARPYGWWCCGENQARKQTKAAIRELEEEA
eukprot:TRINITY_DN511_c0_g1_i1.p2 TRINITY_DN511_c0_g1~~TRINITY_DN511_c0_g1_i1.p2  ORF type:complete len:473 (+),score=217.13 TRINITY_DN511_c0_g1_i1:66-1484(+)